MRHDTYRVQGTLRYSRFWVGEGICPLCREDQAPFPCVTHSASIDLDQRETATDPDSAIDQVVSDFEQKQRLEGWDVEPDEWRAYWVRDPIVTNETQIERDRQALADWIAGMPIPGGEPVAFGKKW